MRASFPMIRWYERIAAALDARGVSRAEVGRTLDNPVTGQAITLKLQGKRSVSVEELKVMAKLAGMTVAEAMGDDLVLLELEDEKDVIELYRLMTPEQRARWLAIGQDVVGANRPREEAE